MDLIKEAKSKLYFGILWVLSNPLLYFVLLLSFMYFYLPEYLGIKTVFNNFDSGLDISLYIGMGVLGIFCFLLLGHFLMKIGVLPKRKVVILDKKK